MNTKELLGLFSVIIAFIGYVPYIRNLLAGKTKPHMFSWIIWSLLTAIGLFAQLSDNAGPGAWTTVLTLVICLFITVMSIRKGTRQITVMDWVALGLGIGATLLWAMAKTPLYSVILVTIADFFGFLPTLRKTYYRPYEETLSTYALSGAKYGIALFAMNNISLITSLYPVYLIVVNGLFVALATIRRGQIKQ